jgi:DNA primase large subunit
MSTINQNTAKSPLPSRDSLESLRQNDMMAHLLDALDRGDDIGHYGRLVFAMVGHHFMDEDKLVRHLSRNPDFGEEKARALVHQVKQRGYSPPKREKVLEWQKQQEFPICPGEDPDGCNIYRNMKFPDGVYEKIEEYHEQKAGADAEAVANAAAVGN